MEFVITSVKGRFTGGLLDCLAWHEEHQGAYPHLRDANGDDVGDVCWSDAVGGDHTVEQADSLAEVLPDHKRCRVCESGGVLTFTENGDMCDECEAA